MFKESWELTSQESRDFRAGSMAYYERNSSPQQGSPLYYQHGYYKTRQVYTGQPAPSYEECLAASRPRTAQAAPKRAVNEPSPSQERKLLFAQRAVLSPRSVFCDKVLRIKMDVGAVEAGADKSKKALIVSLIGGAHMTKAQAGHMAQCVATIMGCVTIAKYVSEDTGAERQTRFRYSGMPHLSNNRR